jgi:hypothetical protein
MQDIRRAPAWYDTPVAACFGPNEPVDFEKLQNGEKLPCYYTKTSKGLINYWEEHACDVLLKSNCYCFAINRYIGSYCEPGVGGAGIELPSPIKSCNDAVRGVIADGAVQVDRKTVYSKQPTGHYIAMAIQPSTDFYMDSGDFHFWRLEKDGSWAYKGGQTLSRRTYRDGRKLADIERPNARGDYKHFCGYFEVWPGRHKLGNGTKFWRSRVPQRFKAWAKAGLRSASKQLPRLSKAWRLAYNEFWDAGWTDDSISSSRVFAPRSSRVDMLLWEYRRSARPLHAHQEP